jgi:DNA-binding protein HU-beta
MKLMDFVKGKRGATKPPKTMYTTDLVRTIAKKHRLSQRLVAEVFGGALGEIQDGLVRGTTVQLTNFGTFYAALRPAAHARNFKTKQLIDIPEMQQPRFRAGKALKRSVRAKKR